MKYDSNNKPLVCMMKNSTCYKGTRTFTVKGVLWHSTGANNPNLKRYVQPCSNDANYSSLMKLLGTNTAKNDWNHIYREAGVNAWIGKLADGTVTTVQTMPWNYRPWGCGKGKYGSCNNTHLQFEICESNLSDRDYFNKVYKEACEFTAYICKLYNLDPKGYTYTDGRKVPVILCHQDSYKLGVGGNHSDVYHWFNKHGKTMNDVRNDVAKLMAGGSVSTSTSSSSASSTTSTTSKNPEAKGYLMKGDTGSAVKTMQTMLIACGYSCGSSGVDGSFGNATLEALKKFQKAYGLEVDGYYGSKSKAKLTKVYNEKKAGTNDASKKGYTGTFPVLPSRGYFILGDGYKTLKNYTTQIKRLQMFLNWAINAGLKVDGDYGQATKAAVTKFQKTYGLTVDGSFGKNSLNKAKAIKK